MFSACSVQSRYKEDQLRSSQVEFRDAMLPGYELGSGGIELNWQLQKNGKKGIRL
jgi:hypothetical protein